MYGIPMQLFIKALNTIVLPS